MMTQRTALFVTFAGLLSAISINARAEMIFHRGNGSEPQSLDPQMAEGVPESTILRDLFEGLTAENANAEIVPGIAESWAISKDGKTYTFHLRDSNWSDGEPITAEDVVYAMRRAVNPETASGYAFLLYPITNAESIVKGEKAADELGVKALDSKTVQIDLIGPTPYFLSILANPVAYPVPAHIVEQYRQDWTKPEHIVSNGAFTMREWLPQSHITLAKSAQYWDRDAVRLDQVIYYPTEDKTSELNRYRAGELDWTADIPNEQRKWIEANLNDELKTANYLGTTYYGFNNTHPIFNNKALRAALTLAIDRNVLVEKVTGNGEEPAYSIVVPGIDNHNPYTPAWATWPRDKQIAAAKEYYAKAGYGEDNPLHIDLLYATNENNRKVAIAVASMWKSILGVTTTQNNKEWKAFLATPVSERGAYASRWIGDYNDPNTFLEIFTTSSGITSLNFNNETFDQLINTAAREQDAAKRRETLGKAEQILSDEFALAPLYYSVSNHMVKPYVKGYRPNVVDHAPSKYIYIEKK